MSENESHHDSRAAAELATVDFDYAAIDGEESVDAAEAYRQAAREALDFYRRVFMCLQDYRGDKAFANDCAMLALGWNDLARAKTQEELSRRHKCERANVARMVNKIQALVGIPPMAGQRCMAARAKFSQARKQQLKTP